MSNGDSSSLPRIGVLAKRGKVLGGGLTELRSLLTAAGHPDPLWVEVGRGKRVPKAAEKLVAKGAERILVWGGDGTIQRALAAVDGTGVQLAVFPAGTANTFAQNLGVPTDLEQALRIALGGWTARVDVGKVRGERFCVAAGVGFDALLVREADKTAKGRFGRAAYVMHGVKRAGTVPPVTGRVEVDGNPWFEGELTTVLVANAATLMGGMQAFPDARMDDGKLEVGVVTANGRLDWLRVAGRVVAGKAGTSPFVDVTQGAKVVIRLDEPLRYEVDGGERGKVTKLTIRARPGAITVCVPAPDRAGSAETAERAAPSGQAAAVAQSIGS